MSSKFVKDTFKTFLASDLPAETNVIDLSGESRELQDFMDGYSLTDESDWLGMQFGADPERPITVPATNSSGKYREDGFVLMHIVTPALANAPLVQANLDDRSKVIMDLFRGRTISGVKILNVGFPNFESGATLEMEGGFQSCTVTINYQNDVNL